MLVPPPFDFFFVNRPLTFSCICSNKLMVYLTDLIRFSFWFDCKINNKAALKTSSKKQIYTIAACCKSWSRIPINSALGQFVIIHLTTLIWYSNTHETLCKHLHEIRPSIIESLFIVIRRVWIFVGNIAAFFLDIMQVWDIFDTLFLRFSAFLFIY